MRRQTAVTAYFLSKQLLLFAFARRYRQGAHQVPARDWYRYWPPDGGANQRYWQTAEEKQKARGEAEALPEIRE